MSIYDGEYCDRDTCNNATLIGEQRFDGEIWLEYSCDVCTYYFMRRVVTEPRKTHLELLEHQLEAAEALGNGKVLWGGVGSGKSITALYYYMKKEAPRPIYVITTAKKRDSLDWVGEAAKFGIGMEHDATIAGVLTVDSWQNLHKYVDVDGAFFIFDEQRLVGTGSWYKSFIKITKNNRWILLSATPGDTWMDYIALFVANGFYKNLTEFKQEHVVYNTFSKYPKVDRYRNVGRLVRNRSKILVHMPYQKHTKRHVHVVKVEHDADELDVVHKKRWHPYERRPLNDIGEMFLVMRKVVNSDPSRLEAVRALMREHPRLIIFYNFNFELDMLRELAKEPEWQTISSTQSSTLGSGLGVRSETSSEKSFPSKKKKTISSNSSSMSTHTDEKSYPLNQMRFMEDDGPTTAQELGEQSLGTVHISNGVQIAEWNGQKHEPVPKTDRWIYLVQYTAGSEGWNCVETDAMVLFSLSYSYKATHQSMGRIDRLNTPFVDLHYYVLKSDSVIDDAVWRSLKSKKSFNEKSFAESQKW